MILTTHSFKNEEPGSFPFGFLSAKFSLSSFFRFSPLAEFPSEIVSSTADVTVEGPSTADVTVEDPSTADVTVVGPSSADITVEDPSTADDFETGSVVRASFSILKKSQIESSFLVFKVFGLL